MVFVLFFLELMTVRYASFGHSHSHFDDHEHHLDMPPAKTETETKQSGVAQSSESEVVCAQTAEGGICELTEPSHALGDDHLGHGREHMANEELAEDWESPKEQAESYVSQITAIFILEFGIVFHSVFIGLTLAVSGNEFIPLYVVLVFHQTFEGLGLGTRLASAPWPKSKQNTPYWLALGFGISTPTAIAVGLGVRNTYPPASQTTLIVNGIFDSLSAGILIYTGLVELMAHEFMFSPKMRKAPIRTVIAAYLQMCLGAGTYYMVSNGRTTVSCDAGLMALLGKWA
jgi:solute carrier family 39 (zinc transporter), member 1/2/3